MVLLITFLLNLAIAEPITGVNLMTSEPVKIEPGKRGTVLVFMSSECPCSHSHVSEVRQLAKDFPDFHFAAVHANADESIEESRTYFKAADLPFPVIGDSQAKLADQFKASKTPHAFVVSPAGEVLYRGGVTDSKKLSDADRHYLREALQDLVADQPVRTAEARTLGCAISRGKSRVW